MPLYACSKCRAVENTALGDYWVSQSDCLHTKAEHRPLCSECSTGTWHGRFPKVSADNGDWEPDRGNFIRHKKSVAEAIPEII